MDKQRTLNGAFTLQGVGLHTGLMCEATFKPAPVNTGIVFEITSATEGEKRIEAVAENVKETSRGTVIGKGDLRVSTIEHAMSALYALGVDNCIVEVNQPEMPILDGSAKAYVEKINEVGVAEQESDREYFVVRKKTEYKIEATGSTYTLLPDEEFGVNVMVEYDSPVLSNQFASIDSMSEYAEQVAGCRTFVFVKEIEALVKNNLIKGGDLANAIVIYDKEISQSEMDHLCDILGKEHITANSLGYLNKEALMFNNEPARHKLLDVIGDLALIGKRIKGRVIAHCPGHTANTEVAKKIYSDLRRQPVPVPVYDPNKAPILGINDIKAILPHRWPMQLVDKVIEKTDEYVIGVKCVTSNEQFFCGHFPEEPVMPGVLIVEAMAQTGGLLVLTSLEDPKGYSTYFMKIDNVKFRQKVVPGDTLIFRVGYVTPLRRGCAVMKGYAYVGDKLVAEAEYMAQIIKNK